MKLSKQKQKGNVPFEHASPCRSHSKDNILSNSNEYSKEQISTTTNSSVILKLIPNKPKTQKACHRLTRSVEYTPAFDTEKVENTYDNLTTSRKLKQDYLKKFAILSNRINKLKIHEKELEIKLKNQQQKQKKIETIKKDKVHLKNKINKIKELELQHLQEQKDRVKTRRQNDAERLNTLHEITAEKRKNLFDISKAEQNLVKTMITQTNTKRETMNKYKYLQSKEQQTLNKQLEQKRKIEKENKKISKNKELSEYNMLMANELKEKCLELEKLEEEYINNLKKTKMKACIMNKSFLNESLKNGTEMNDVSFTATTTKGMKHKSRSIKDNLKEENNTKRYSKNVLKVHNIKSARNVPSIKDNKKISESYTTMKTISQYKP